MILSMAKFELKNLIREKMTVVMLLWPLILGGIAKYLIDRGMVEDQAMAVVVMILSLIGGFAYGAMAGFSLLDDRDDQVFDSIQISPVSLQFYIWFKVCFIYLLSVLASFFIMWFIGVLSLTVWEILLISALAALQTPFSAFLINSYAKNKVEGFVTMKATGFLLLLPIGGFFFLDGKEWLFSIAPGHWAAKAVQFSLFEPQIRSGMISMNLNFYQYIGIGFVYNLLLIMGAYSMFKKKNNL